jgi:hypothetical protein
LLTHSKNEQILNGTPATMAEGFRNNKLSFFCFREGIREQKYSSLKPFH